MQCVDHICKLTTQTDHNGLRLSWTKEWEYFSKTEATTGTKQKTRSVESGSVLEHLPRVQGALSSTPIPQKERKQGKSQLWHTPVAEGSLGLDNKILSQKK